MGVVIPFCRPTPHPRREAETAVVGQSGGLPCDRQERLRRWVAETGLSNLRELPGLSQLSIAFESDTVGIFTQNAFHGAWRPTLNGGDFFPPGYLQPVLSVPDPSEVALRTMQAVMIDLLRRGAVAARGA